MPLKFYIDETPGYWFISTTILKHRNILLDEYILKIFKNAFLFYRDKYVTKNISYVIMPNHFHAILYFENSTNLGNFIQEFKRFTNKKIIEYFKQINDQDHLEYFKKNKSRKHINFQIWENNFDRFRIINQENFDIKLDYIHYNPVKAGLVESPEEYPFSSYNFYRGDVETFLPVDNDINFF